MDIGHTFRADSSSAPTNTIPFRPCLSHPPMGMNGTTPCGVGNAMRPAPGVAPGAAQPRALCHNALGVGGGEPRMDVDGMGVDRRRWARTNFPIRKRPRSGDRRFPSGNPKVARCPISLRESQRDSAIKPGVAPRRRYPGYRPHRVPYPARGCAVRARRGCDIKGRNGIGFAGAEEESARNVCPISPKYTHLTYNPFEPSAQPRWSCAYIS